MDVCSHSGRQRPSRLAWRAPVDVCGHSRVFIDSRCIVLVVVSHRSTCQVPKLSKRVWPSYRRQASLPNMNCRESPWLPPQPLPVEQRVGVGVFRCRPALEAAEGAECLSGGARAGSGDGFVMEADVDDGFLQASVPPDRRQTRDTVAVGGEQSWQRSVRQRRCRGRPQDFGSSGRARDLLRVLSPFRRRGDIPGSPGSRGASAWSRQRRQAIGLASSG